MPASDLAEPAAPVFPHTPDIEISLADMGTLNLPQFVRGVREFYLGTLHGKLPPPLFDAVRSVDAAWLARIVLESQGVQLPATPLVDVTVSEMAAFNRFCECAEDGEGYDVDKGMMRRLADIGLVRSQGFGRFTTTAYGVAVRALPKDCA
jgi:hypothetical protein